MKIYKHVWILREPSMIHEPFLLQYMLTEPPPSSVHFLYEKLTPAQVEERYGFKPESLAANLEAMKENLKSP